MAENLNSVRSLYILDDQHRPQVVDSLEQWALGDRRVASDEIGDVRISTVFLGLDHGFGDGPPVLFETMVFGGQYDEQQWRCCTWDQAVAQHAMALMLVTSHGR